MGSGGHFLITPTRTRVNHVNQVHAHFGLKSHLVKARPRLEKSRDWLTARCLPNVYGQRSQTDEIRISSTQSRAELGCNMKTIIANKSVESLMTQRLGYIFFPTICAPPPHVR